MQDAVYTMIFSEITLKKIRDYKDALDAGTAVPGARLRHDPAMSTRDFIGALLATKQPRIFAESEIKGDGTHWNATELSILGDVNIAVDVNVFDNGVWSPSDPAFAVHAGPFAAQLLFTPGALLTPAAPDLAEVTTNGCIDQEKYNALVERRIMPLLAHINSQGKPAIIALPGIGCGAFAGTFRGTVARHLDIALQAVLDKYANNLPQIRAVFFDPFDECTAGEENIGGIRYVRQPRGLPQLSHPQDYGYGDCKLYKIVAWDHVSWPGNDFFAGSRFTDDGVAAAATDCMARITGVAGTYRRGAYLPPAPHITWQDATAGKQLQAAKASVSPDGLCACIRLWDDMRKSKPKQGPKP